jgi:hypothetical protein
MYLIQFWHNSGETYHDYITGMDEYINKNIDKFIDMAYRVV